jgi:hypothetical protein
MATIVTGGRAVLALVTALTLISPAALADTDMGTTGAVGRHHLRDSAATPGATCVYVDADTDMILDTMIVRPPVMFARDRTAARDRQVVGWRIVLMGWVVVGPWEFELRQMATGPIHRATAWDDQRATFDRDAIAIEPGARTYEAWVRMLWYKPGDPTTVVGSSRHRVDLYHVEGDDTPWPDCIASVT